MSNGRSVSVRLPSALIERLGIDRDSGVTVIQSAYRSP